MPHHCKAHKCDGSCWSKDGKKVGFFQFPFKKAPQLVPRWLSFLNRPDFVPVEGNKSQGVCSQHFEDKFLRISGNRLFLKWELNPVPSIQAPATAAFSSCFRSQSFLRKEPFDRREPDQLEKFRKENAVRHLSDIKNKHVPHGYEFKSGENFALFQKFEFDESGVIPLRISGSIYIDRELHVKLHANGCPVPLPDFFSKGSDCKLSCGTTVQELANYLNSQCELLPFPFIDELNKIKYYKAQGRPSYSSELIRYCLLLKHTSAQTYRLLLEQFPLPSFSLLSKIESGSIESYRAASALKAKGSISEDVILLLDEMYLQKQAQYHSGKYFGEDENGNLYKGILVFMIVGLKENTPFVVKAVPETKITGSFVASHIWEVIGNLAEVGFNVRGVCADNHSTNVAGFYELLHEYPSTNKTDAFQHPANKSHTYPFFDSVHLLKNIRNNLLNAKSFSFPEFEFDVCGKKISAPAGGLIAWRELHLLYEADSSLKGHLRKAPKLNYSVLHPGNKKQCVNIALAIFDQTTIAALKRRWPPILLGILAGK